MLFLMQSVLTYAQQPITYLGSVKKSQLSEYKALDQLTKQVTEKAKSLLCEFTTKVNGRVVIMTCKTNEFNKEIISLLKRADAGSKLFVDVIFNGQRSKKRSYILMITEN